VGVYEGIPPIAMPTLPILVYHLIGEVPRDARFPCNYVRPCQFEAQLRLLRYAGFESISFGHYLEYRGGRCRVPKRPIVITFDDGYRSTLDVAAPYLARFGFGATMFVVTNRIGDTNRWDVEDRQQPLLTANEIRAWHDRGIEFESHTATHPRLPTLSNADILRELAESRRALEAIVDRPVSVISYPWGARNEATLDCARDAGYAAGVIVRRRTNFDDTPLLELRRIGINCETTLSRFAWDLARLRWRTE
jgi:peptidoglycan/xylan/chitin deacetylase (PgdA/CDA1 family)